MAQHGKSRSSTPEDLQYLLQLHSNLLDDLLTLGDVLAGLLAGEALPRAADGKALLVQQTAYLPNDQYVAALVVAPVPPSLYRFELRELLLPVTQYMRLDAAQLADFTDGEVSFARNGRQFAIVSRFQHMPLLAP